MLRAETLTPDQNMQAGYSALLPDPGARRRARLPGAGDAPRLLAQRLGVRTQLGVERKLFAGILACVVDLGTPLSQRTEVLHVGFIDPPLIFQGPELAGVATVQSDYRPPHLAAPATIATVGLKPRGSLVARAYDPRGRRLGAPDRAVVRGRSYAVAHHQTGKRRRWVTDSCRKLAQLGCDWVG
jgi:hypothetical protein